MPKKGQLKDVTAIQIKRRKKRLPPEDDFRGTIRYLVEHGFPWPYTLREEFRRAS